MIKQLGKQKTRDTIHADTLILNLKGIYTDPISKGIWKPKGRKRNQLLANYISVS